MQKAMQMHMEQQKSIFVSWFPTNVGAIYALKCIINYIGKYTYIG